MPYPDPSDPRDPADLRPPVRREDAVGRIALDALEHRDSQAEGLVA